MAYVDLNPVRAKMAKTPEALGHPVVKTRIEILQEDALQPLNLAEFLGNLREPMPMGLPFHLKDYIALVDWTGKQIRENKCGAIDSILPDIIDRLDIDPQHWLILTTKLESRFKSIVGVSYAVKKAGTQFGFKRASEFSNCQSLFG